LYRPLSTELLHTPSFEESGIGRILLYIGCVALFGGIHFAFFFDVSLLTSVLSPVPLWLRLAGGTGGISLWRDILFVSFTSKKGR
jgi:hypothetical protein